MDDWWCRTRFSYHRRFQKKQYRQSEGNFSRIQPPDFRCQWNGDFHLWMEQRSKPIIQNDNNFTKNKLDDRIKWLNGHTDEYLRILNEMDQQEEADEIPGELTKEDLEAKLKEAQERLARYEGYQKLMEETGVSQLSITDADAKLMKNNEWFCSSI